MRTGLVLTVALLGLALQSGCGRAQAFESFTLEQHDQLIAEQPGCEAECRIVGKSRTCTMKDSACRAICRTLPQCRPDGEQPIKVCAIIRGRE